jgi:hypothetical protein
MGRLPVAVRDADRPGRDVLPDKRWERRCGTGRRVPWQVTGRCFAKCSIACTGSSWRATALWSGACPSLSLSASKRAWPNRDEAAQVAPPLPLILPLSRSRMPHSHGRQTAGCSAPLLDSFRPKKEERRPLPSCSAFCCLRNSQAHHEGTGEACRGLRCLLVWGEVGDERRESAEATRREGTGTGRVVRFAPPFRKPQQRGGMRRPRRRQRSRARKRRRAAS